MRFVFFLGGGEGGGRASRSRAGRGGAGQCAAAALPPTSTPHPLHPTPPQPGARVATSLSAWANRTSPHRFASALPVCRLAFAAAASPKHACSRPACPLCWRLPPPARATPPRFLPPFVCALPHLSPPCRLHAPPPTLPPQDARLTQQLTCTLAERPPPPPPPLPPQDVRLTQQLIDERLGAELLGRVAFYGQSEVSALLEVWGMWEREGGGEVHGHIARPRPPHPGPRPLAHPPRPRWPPPTRSLAPLPSAHPPPMRAATVERPRLQGRAGAAG